MVTLSQIYVRGYVIRTRNDIEQTPNGQIGKTWERVRQKAPTHPAAALFEYENDSNGYFTEIIGEECTALDELEQNEAVTRVPSGRYAKFSKQGKMPDIVLEAWQEVWQAEKSGVLQRAYTVDFERYPGEDQVELYIAIK